MGTVIISIAHLQTNFINFDVVLISIPMFILIGDILLANNIRDLDNDKLSGRKDLCYVFGRE